MELSYSDFCYITDKLSQFYINNENTTPFLKEHNYRICLNQYLCVCYGVEVTLDQQRTRKIEFFQILGSVENNTGYYIQTFHLPNEIQLNEPVSLIPNELIKIQDCNYLRQNIFQFQDKTSLFRSTLFFVPQDSKLYRIHCTLQFLTLPILSLDDYKCIVCPEKFIVSYEKKKQILKRLHEQMALSEASLIAHGALERTLS